MREFAEKFYKGNAWKKCRDGFISQRILVDGGMCQECRESLGLIVHHRVEVQPWNVTDADVTLNWNNLEYVCLECHNRIHGRFVNQDRVAFDADGNVIPL